MRNKMELNAIFVGLDFFPSSSSSPFELGGFYKEHTAMSVFYSLTINLLLVVQLLNYRTHTHKKRIKHTYQFNSTNTQNIWVNPFRTLWMRDGVRVCM